MRTKMRYEICVFPSLRGTEADKIGERFARGRDEALAELKRATAEHPDKYIIVRQSYWRRSYGEVGRWAYRVLHKLTHNGLGA